jgi:hypothetical protein
VLRGRRRSRRTRRPRRERRRAAPPSAAWLLGSAIRERPPRPRLAGLSPPGRVEKRGPRKPSLLRRLEDRRPRLHAPSRSAHKKAAWLISLGRPVLSHSSRQSRFRCRGRHYH